MRYVLYWKVPTNIAKQVSDLADEIGAKPTKIETHCSIFHCLLDSQHEKRLIDSLSLDYSSNDAPLMQLQSAEYYSPNIFAFKIKKTNVIQKVHDNILSNIQNLPIIPQSKLVFDKSDQLLLSNYYMYGFPYFGVNFNPHMSVGAVEKNVYDLNKNKVISELFKPEKIVLIRKDDMCILKEFNL